MIDANAMEFQRGTFNRLHGTYQIETSRTCDSDVHSVELAKAEMRESLLEFVYGDANRAVSEMEYAVMSSLMMDVSRDQVAEMFRKLRATIPLK